MIAKMCSCNKHFIVMTDDKAYNIILIIYLIILFISC